MPTQPTHFPAAFRRWMTLEQPSLSLRQLADLTGVANPDLSRIRSGKSRITQSALSRLIPAIRAAFGPEPAARLLCSYLMDEIPDHQEDLVDVSARSATIAEGAVDPLETALEYLARRAAADSRFAEWIIMLHTIAEHPGDLERRIADYRRRREK